MFFTVFVIQATDGGLSSDAVLLKIDCGCRKLCHPMRPGHTRGSDRRGDPAAEPGRLHL